MSYLKRLFVLPADAVKLRQEQIAEAELLALDHRANHERELAMARMYEERVERLRQQEPVSA